MTDGSEKLLVRTCLVLALTMSGIAVFNTSKGLWAGESRAARARSFEPIRAFADSAPLVGEPKARRTVFLATDYMCPYCRAMHDSLAAQMKADPLSVNIRILPFPLARLHPSAPKSAAFLVCASQRGVQAVADSLLYRLGAAIDSTSTEAIAARVGLDSSAQWLSECVASRRVAEYLVRVGSIASAAGATATPTMWINGRRFVGTTSISALFAARP